MRWVNWVCVYLDSTRWRELQTRQREVVELNGKVAQPPERCTQLPPSVWFFGEVITDESGCSVKRCG